MVVTTAEVRAAATDVCRKQLELIHEELHRHEKREDKLYVLNDYPVPPEANTFMKLTSLREDEHIMFMKHMMPYIDSCSDHDWSKDKLCKFALSSFFDGKCTSPEAIKLKDEEIQRHYMLEPHHPEWENYHDAECSETDIIEMAVDRLARCVQFGDGMVYMSNMMKFLPKFPKGNQQAKVDLFLQSCEQYKNVVEKEFLVFYPDVKYWK